MSSSGRWLTLYDVLETERALWQVGGIRKCTYAAPVLLAGAGFERPEEMRFSSWHVRYSVLSRWAGREAFTWSHSALVETEPQTTIAYRRPPELDLVETGDLRLTLVHHLSEAWRHADEAEIELRDVVAVRVSRLARNSLEGYFESSLCFQRFLTLVTDELVRPLSVNAVVAQPDNTGSADDAFVEVLYQPVEAAKGVKQRRGSPMLLKLEEISGHEAEYVSNWFKMAERLKPVADLYFGTLYNPSAYLDFNFLCLAHAAEAYHRHVIGGEDVPAEDHEKRMGEVVGAVPEQYQKWLREKLRWSNELSLRRRLKELFSKWAHILTPDKVGDHGDVVRSIVSFRQACMKAAGHRC